MPNDFYAMCTGYRAPERYFTIGNLYKVTDHSITNDHGYTYYDRKMEQASDPDKWYLADWYEFEIIEEHSVPDQLEISIDDILGITASR